MEDVKILTVSDLLRYGRPHTGLSTPGPPTISDQNPQPPSGGSSSIHYRNLETLTRLDYPAILVGTLTLPTLTLKCPHKNCLEFSDDSFVICCDIIGLDLRVIGQKIHVLTWNFIPFDHLGGFLEIVKWKLLDWSDGLGQCSSLIIDSFPLVSSSTESKPSNAKSYQIHGVLESVSPLSVVPCSVNDTSSSNSVNLRGFLVRIMTCECQLCRSEESVIVLYGATDCHSFTEPVSVYFCGSAWCWHPVVMKLIGNVVTISGLKKKLVFMGKQDSDLMFLTAENSVVHLPRLLKKWVPLSSNVVKKNDVCGSYTGTVNNVCMQGMIVELDKEVWLLLTDQSLVPPHGLRIGAVISVANVHVVNPNFSRAKFLVLGACFRTSIKVESFSPFQTRCLILSQSQCRLGKFIETLAFSTRLWVLLLVSSFQKKFSGILSRKKILGSRHVINLLTFLYFQKEGLVQMFASLHLPSVFLARYGVVREFIKHESSGCATEPYHGNLKLVVPISSFIHHCETSWIKTLLPSDNVQPASCGGKSYLPSIRKTFQSEDLGIILVGMLKMSSPSGRLQLVDKTGSIDAVIPDLPSFWNPNAIFEVIDYSLIVEGMPASVHSGLESNDSVLCGGIFQGFPLAGKKNLKMFVYFHLRKATCRNLLIYPSGDCQDELKESEGGKFHLIRITRKFPLLLKFKGDSLILKRPVVFAEAIVLPWYLFLAGKAGSMHHCQVSRDCTGGNHVDHAPSKRRKADCASSWVSPGFKNNFGSACFEEGSSSFMGTCGDQSCWRTSFSHEISCLATIRGFNNFIFTSSGTLYRTKGNAKVKVCKESAEKILLEFTSESDLKYYQLLRIGDFYLMKQRLEGHDNLIGAKVLMTYGTFLRSLSLSSEVLSSGKSLHDSSVCNDEGSRKDQVLGVIGDPSVSDVHLHVYSSLTSLLDLNKKELGNGRNAPGANLEENSGSLDYSCLFPKGNLTSLHGDIIAVHGFDQGSSDMHSSREDFGDLHHYGFPARTKRSCIHVSTANQAVRIFGSLGQHLFPTGFGPGINATFHQILEFGDLSTMMLTPVSSIVINSIRAVNEACSENCSSDAR